MKSIAFFRKSESNTKIDMVRRENLKKRDSLYIMCERSALKKNTSLILGERRKLIEKRCPRTKAAWNTWRSTKMSREKTPNYMKKLDRTPRKPFKKTKKLYKVTTEPPKTMRRLSRVTKKMSNETKKHPKASKKNNFHNAKRRTKVKEKKLFRRGKLQIPVPRIRINAIDPHDQKIPNQIRSRSNPPSPHRSQTLYRSSVTRNRNEKNSCMILQEIRCIHLDLTSRKLFPYALKMIKDDLNSPKYKFPKTI